MKKRNNYFPPPPISMRVGHLLSSCPIQSCKFSFVLIPRFPVTKTFRRQFNQSSEPISTDDDVLSKDVTIAKPRVPAFSNGKAVQRVSRRKKNFSKEIHRLSATNVFGKVSPAEQRNRALIASRSQGSAKHVHALASPRLHSCQLKSLQNSWSSQT